ncbi:hypothetical protein ACCQ08_03120 [Comamonas sp. SY3]|uniref:hypothetical protein n=1 Tax=Comamonas sp. SY3 TaxID=3243601 RepID=UPI003594241A
MTDLSPKERIFEMLATLARLVADTPDLNAERQHLATLIDHCRSWETQVLDIQPTDQAAAARQEIADEIQGLTREHIEIVKIASAEIEQKRLNLRQRCGAIGHVFARSFAPFMNGQRQCAICDAAEVVAVVEGLNHG